MPNASPTPCVDDVFWFEFSKTQVLKAVQARDDAASKLQILAIWLWGIYTGGAAIGFSLGGKEISNVGKFVIVCASASLIAVYWATVWVQMPITGDFDPRVPETIMKAYDNDIVEKQRRLGIALGLSLLASMMVAFSLALASSKPKMALPAVVPSLAAGLYGDVDGNEFVAIEAVIDKADVATICVQPKLTLGPKAPVQCMPQKPTNMGSIQVSVPVGKAIKAATATISWDNPQGSTSSLSRDITLLAKKID